MSILIKGMDKETAVRICAYAGVRMDDSDFVPVPPHGDLIDKDATMNAILEERGEDTACWFAGIVNDMPAIIPAEED